MRPFWLFVRLRLADVASPAVAGLHFGLPLVLMLVCALVFGAGHPFERRRVAVVAAGGAVPPAVAAALAPFPEVCPEPCDALALGMRRLAAGAVDAVIAAGPAPRVIAGERHALLGRALASVLAVPAVETVPVPPGAYLRYLFPGLVTWTILVSGLLGMGQSLVRHRRNHFFRKLATTPCPPATFVGAQIVARTLLTLVQIALMTGVAALAFSLPVSLAALLPLALVAGCGLLTFVGAGFALAAAIDSETAYADTANALTVAILLVSEVFYPVDALPRWLSALSPALPSTQVVRLLRLVLLDGATSFEALAPGIAVLAAWAVVTFSIAARSFRWYGG